jgi:hypothetical protein
MKLGPVDGNVEEVRDLLKNFGLNLEDFIEKPTSPLRMRFLVIPVVIFLSSVLVLGVLPTGSLGWQLLVILSIAGGTWTCASTQLRFRNPVATFCVAMGFVLMILLAAGLISLKEAAEAVMKLKGE